ncbi:MAG: hypothetical protein HRU80_03305 [Ignavibacteriales bacterium]|nr:MAG: hypothetical protein HRU80_03305 [Ignavibacteriales bacterium]
MNEEMIIELLEPFQTDKFNEGIRKLPAEELERALIQIEEEISKISGNGESLNITNPYDDEALFKLIFELYTEEETPLIKRAVEDYISRGILKREVLEPGERFANLLFKEREKVKPEGKDNLEGYLTYVNEIKNGNQRLRDSYNYYIKILLPLIETLRAEHISKQAKEPDTQISGIEPIEWKKEITDLYYFLNKLYENGYINNEWRKISKFFTFQGKPIKAKNISQGISKLNNYRSSGLKGSETISKIMNSSNNASEEKS